MDVLGLHPPSTPTNKKHLRFINMAKEIAMNGKGVGGRNGNNFRLGAVLVRDCIVVATATNSYRTHPILQKYYPYPFIHAEAGAIIRAGLANGRGADLYVGRVLRNNAMALAKPCACCLNLIEAVGIRHVFYSTVSGYAQLT